MKKYLSIFTCAAQILLTTAVPLFAMDVYQDHALTDSNVSQASLLQSQLLSASSPITSLSSHSISSSSSSSSGNVYYSQTQTAHTSSLLDKMITISELQEYTSSYLPFSKDAQLMLSTLKPVIQANDLCDLVHRYVARAEDAVGKLKDGQFCVQKAIIAPESEVCVIGDIHGSAQSLVKILRDLIKNKYLDENLKIIKSDFYLVCLGDYVDRGSYGAEVLYLLLQFKLANWDKVFLLRGNHEAIDLNVAVGCYFNFFHELRKKYDSDAQNILYRIGEFYDYLPQALYLKAGDNWMQYSHGGLDSLRSDLDNNRAYAQ